MTAPEDRAGEVRPQVRLAGQKFGAYVRFVLTTFGAMGLYFAVLLVAELTGHQIGAEAARGLVTAAVFICILSASPEWHRLRATLRSLAAVNE